eukprot:365453-Chlamydomonas_euryale.AAC.4
MQSTVNSRGPWCMHQVHGLVGPQPPARVQLARGVNVCIHPHTSPGHTWSHLGPWPASFAACVATLLPTCGSDVQTWAALGATCVAARPPNL